MAPPPKQAQQDLTHAASRADDAPCRLLALPRELRDLIYEYVFSSTEIEIEARHRDRCTSLHKLLNYGLTFPCKQIYSETVEAYYKHTPFFSLSGDGIRMWPDGLHDGARKAMKNAKVICIVAASDVEEEVGHRVRKRVEWEMENVGVEAEVVKLVEVVERFEGWVEIDVDCFWGWGL